jgi:hypothetical protein
MTTRLKALAIALALPGAGSAQAATLDFTTATNDGTTLVAAGATVLAGTGTTLQVGDFIANAVCPLGGAGCNGSMVLVFDQNVKNVKLQYGFGDPGDTATLTIFDGAGGIIGGTTLFLTSGTATEDLSFFGTFRSIAFDNTAAAGAGYAYGDITYDLAAIPLPATLPLLLAAAGALVALRRRRAA